MDIKTIQLLQRYENRIKMIQGKLSLGEKVKVMYTKLGEIFFRKASETRPGPVTQRDPVNGRFLKKEEKKEVNDGNSNTSTT